MSAAVLPHWAKARCARQNPSYFHYTTISTLSRILDNGLLRLTNIKSPRLNDYREPREFGPSKMRGRICIGCFSADRMENNTMWSAYGRPETETIVIRIPSRVMEEMCKCSVFVDRNAKRDKFCALDEMGRIEDRLACVSQAKCFHHVAMSGMNFGEAASRRFLQWRLRGRHCRADSISCASLTSGETPLPLRMSRTLSQTLPHYRKK